MYIYREREIPIHIHKLILIHIRGPQVRNNDNVDNDNNKYNNNDNENNNYDNTNNNEICHYQ